MEPTVKKDTHQEINSDKKKDFDSFKEIFRTFKKRYKNQ